MSPIDDELRSLFTSRADLLAPAPDPLAGIETRARRMRRNRVAASVAGTALAVAAIAAVVPAVLPEKVADGGGTQFAGTPSPSPSAPDRVVFSTAALNPASPWPFRGDSAVLGNGTLDTIQREWAVKHPGSTVTPLYGHVYEPSGQAEVVFVATAPGSDRWGVATASESGPEFLVDNVLAPDTKALLAALPGDEVPRLLVLASPASGGIFYAADGAEFRPYEGTDAGVAFIPLEGDTSRDEVRVLDGDGDLDKPVFAGPAPDATPSGDAAAQTPPDNLVSWPPRGITPKTDFLEAAIIAYARGVGAKRGDVAAKVLFTGDDDAGNRYLFGQAWIKGNDAHTFGYSVNGRGEVTPFLGPITDKGPSVLAYIVVSGVGQTRDTLVVVPEPGVKKTFYGQPQSEWIEIVGQDYLNGVTLIDRQPDAQGDLLKLVDAAGRTVFQGEVASLLCGVKSCG